MRNVPDRHHKPLYKQSQEGNQITVLKLVNVLKLTSAIT